jgi:hypothetical protein
MSFVFDIDGQTVWSPALRTGQVFVAYAEALAAEQEAPTGFTCIADDMIAIDRRSSARLW